MTEYKAFNEAYDDIIVNYSKRDRRFKDKRMSMIEKDVLRAYLNIRRNRNRYVVEELSEKLFKLTHSPFIEAHLSLVLGIAKNNLSLFNEALPLFKNAIEIFYNNELKKYHNIACFNLANVYYNLQDASGLQHSLRLLDRLSANDIKEKIRVLRAKFMHAALTKNEHSAKDLFNRIEKLKDHMGPSDLPSHYIGVFNYSVQIEDFSLAEKTLEGLKSHQRFHLSENFKFMRALLDHFLKNKTIYLRFQDLERIPLLAHQAMVLKCLSEKDREGAHTHWKELISLSPGAHGEDFNYTGAKCLFSLCLERLNKETARPLVATSGQTNAQKILHALRQSGGAIKKEKLFEYVWGRPPESKSDFFKLTREISRIRKSENITIKTKLGSYWLLEGSEDKFSA